MLGNAFAVTAVSKDRCAELLHSAVDQLARIQMKRPEHANSPSVLAGIDSRFNEYLNGTAKHFDLHIDDVRKKVRDRIEYLKEDPKLAMNYAPIGQVSTRGRQISVQDIERIKAAAEDYRKYIESQNDRKGGFNGGTFAQKQGFLQMYGIDIRHYFISLLTDEPSEELRGFLLILKNPEIALESVPDEQDFIKEIRKYNISLTEIQDLDSPLSHAIASNNLGTVELLLESGVKTSIFEVASSEQITPEVIELMIAHDFYLGPVELQAILKNPKLGELSKKLLRLDPSLLEQTYDGEPMIHFAIHLGSLPMVKALVESGVNINVKSPKTNLTVLGTAILYSEVEILNYLLSVGVDPNESTVLPADRMLLQLRKERQSTWFGSFLSRWEDEPNKIEDLAIHPLALAILVASPSKVEALLKAGAKINIPTYYQRKYTNIREFAKYAKDTYLRYTLDKYFPGEIKKDYHSDKVLELVYGASD